MHGKGIVHGDIKPENLLIDRKLRIKIADFGQATNNGIDRLTAFGGSKTYMAPEIIKERPYDGTKADLFAVGVVLFALIAGVLPFKDARKSDKNYQLLYSGQHDRFFAAFERVTKKRFSADF